MNVYTPTGQTYTTPGIQPAQQVSKDFPRTGSVPCDRRVGEGVREADLRARQREEPLPLSG